MTEDLTDRLQRMTAGPNTPPALDGLWRRGRTTRRRRRALGASTAGVVLVALLAGGLVWGASGDDEELIAGRGEVLVLAPPAESTDAPVTMTIDAGPPLDGLPTLPSGGRFAVSFTGANDWSRDLSATWSAWDGMSWTLTHDLVMALDGPGAAVPTGDTFVLPDERLTGSGPGNFPSPQARPGWYRVCVDMERGGDPPRVGLPSEPATVCAQLRVLGDLAAAKRGLVPRPPAEPTDGPVALVVQSSFPEGWTEVHPGAFFGVGVEGKDRDRWTRGARADWERWDGRSWTATHLLVAAVGAGEPATYGVDDEPTIVDRPVGFPGSESTRFIAPHPADAPPGWYRVCAELRAQGRRPTRACDQIEVVDSSFGGGETTVIEGPTVDDEEQNLSTATTLAGG